MTLQQIEGPCLPWCFTYNETKNLFIGFLFGIIFCLIVISIILSLQSKKINKTK